MGIPGFQKWLLGSFPEIVRVQQDRIGQEYHHVAFDMNQIIHQAARRAHNREALARAIFRELDRILKNCVPTKSLFFAFDGPGPLAKLMTQRRRRNKTKTQHTDVNANGTKRRYAKSCIDRLEFTPGVELLYFLRDAIEYWAYSRLQNDRKYRGVDIRISGADVPGEGELKLIDFCRAARLHETESIIVVGGDADIVLQGLATIPMRNFFVYLRHFSKVNKTKLNYVISVWELARTLERYFPNESSGVRIDFILFSILNGNDYIPKIRGVTLGRLWRRYLALKTNSRGRDAPFKGQCVVDADRRTFNWPFFYALIDNVGVPVRPVEADVQLQSIATSVGTNSPSQRAPSSRSDTIHSDEYVDESSDDLGDTIVYTGNEDGVPMDEVSEHVTNDCYVGNGVTHAADSDDSESGDSESTTIDEFDEAVDEDQGHIENLVAISGDSNRFYDTERWFRALLWTLHMYIDGYCSDYSFQYGKPYGPSCDVLSKYIRDHNGDPFVIQAPVANTSPLLPHQAAVAMLPRHAAHLLPSPLQRLVRDPKISGKIFLPNDSVDIFALVKAVEEVPLSEYSKEERKRIVYGSPILLRRPRKYDLRPTANAPVQPPGPRFDGIRVSPVIFRKTFFATSAPPCYAWPRDSIPNMMGLPYLTVGGSKLQQPCSEPPTRSPPGGVRYPMTKKRSSRPKRSHRYRAGRVNTALASHRASVFLDDNVSR